MSCATQIIVEGDNDNCVALEDPNKRHLVDEVSIKVSCMVIYVVCCHHPIAIGPLPYVVCTYASLYVCHCGIIVLINIR